MAKAACLLENTAQIIVRERPGFLNLPIFSLTGEGIVEPIPLNIKTGL